jgi:hypothetical protein
MYLHEQAKINSSKIVHETIDGEVIIINFENGVYYSLNSAGTFIWSCIQKNFRVAEILDEIVKVYSGNQEEIKTEVLTFLNDLSKEELILIKKGEENEVFKEKVVPESNGDTSLIKFVKPGLQKYTDMKEMLLLDPIHEVDETGWPVAKKLPNQKNKTK